MVLLMKKFLVVIIIKFIFTTPSFSEVYEINQCYSKGSDTIWQANMWDRISMTKKRIIDPKTNKKITTNEMVKRKEDSIVSIDSEISKIFITNIKSDYSIAYSKSLAKWYRTSDDGKKEKKESEKKWIADGSSASTGLTHDKFWENYLRGLEKKEKIDQEEFDLLTITGDLVVGQRIDKRFIDKNIIFKYKIFVNLKNKTYVKKLESNSRSLSEFSYLCNSQKTKSSESSGGSSGTAFFISNRGHLLTNNHVVEGCSLSKITYKNNDYDAKLLATDKTLDLALLKAELRPKSFFTFSKDQTKKLNKIYVAGYPLGKGLSDDLKISSGIVSSLKGFGDNSNEIQIDAPINPGNSGGPIINENGDLIAIAVSGLAKDQTEGINFGIKSSAAELFLRSNKISPKKSMYSGIKDNDKLREILEQGTVYTYCD
jgi:S1-C subfamily serine protease